MALRLITAPAIEPISLAEAKAHCRIDHNDDDATVTFLIDVATEYLDATAGWLGVALITQTWELVVDAFPTPTPAACRPCCFQITPSGTPAAAIELPWPPLQSVMSVKYVDVNGLQQTMPPSEYMVDNVSKPGWVVPLTTWPATKATANAVEIRFVAGFGDDATDVPATIRIAILLLVGHWYENREAVLAQYQGSATALPLPFAVDALLANWWQVGV